MVSLYHSKHVLLSLHLITCGNLRELAGSCSWCGCRIIYYRHKRACNYVEEEEEGLDPWASHKRIETPPKCLLGLIAVLALLCVFSRQRTKLHASIFCLVVLFFSSSSFLTSFITFTGGIPPPHPLESLITVGEKNKEKNKQKIKMPGIAVLIESGQDHGLVSLEKSLPA